PWILDAWPRSRRSCGGVLVRPLPRPGERIDAIATVPPRRRCRRAQGPGDDDRHLDRRAWAVDALDPGSLLPDGRDAGAAAQPPERRGRGDDADGDSLTAPLRPRRGRLVAQFQTTSMTTRPVAGSGSSMRTSPDR